MNFKNTLLILALLPVFLFTQCSSSSTKKLVKKQKVQKPVKKVYVVNKNVVKDIDGNTYHSVVINDIEWMTSNLRVSHLKDGTPIDFTPSDKGWSKYNMDLFNSWVNKDSLLVPTHGMYYNYNTVDTKKLCPDDWHVASKDEWVNGIMDYTEKDKYPERELRSKTGWHYQDMNGNDKYKLAILPSGYRDGKGKIDDFATGAGFWTSSNDGGYKACVFNTSGGGVGIRVLDGRYGLPVRCVKNKVKENVVRDVDGNSYGSVVIGNNEWMASNLRVTHFNDSTPIKNASSEKNWLKQDSKACYALIKTDTTKVEKYGLYYNCYAIASGKLCPPGWHIATADDWKDAVDFLKSKYPRYTRSTNEMIAKEYRRDRHNIFNKYKMSLVPTGYRSIDDGKLTSNEGVYLWSIKNKDIVFFNCQKGIVVEEKKIGNYDDNLISCGLPVRCVKDKEKSE